MSNWGRIGILVVVMTPTVLWAEPCVTNTFERPLPGATDVLVRVVDVPSARFPALWQEGLLFGYPYKIFSNGQAVLASDFERPEWKIELDCTNEVGACSYILSGDVPPSTPDISRILGQCLLGDDAVGAQITAEEPKPDLLPELEAELEVVTNTGDCPATDIPEGGIVITLQRLLIVAGADPGPVDGLIGPSTLDALSAILEEPVAVSELVSSLDRLRLKLCAPKS